MTKPPIGQVLLDHGAEQVPTRPGWAPIKCPYHADRNASASVNQTLNRFRCHGCGVAGDSLDLIQHHTGLAFVEARRYATDRYGTSVDLPTARRRSTRRYQPRRGVTA